MYGHGLDTRWNMDTTRPATMTLAAGRQRRSRFATVWHGVGNGTSMASQNEAAQVHADQPVLVGQQADDVPPGMPVLREAVQQQGRVTGPAAGSPGPASATSCASTSPPSRPVVRMTGPAATLAIAGRAER